MSSRIPLQLLPVGVAIFAPMADESAAIAESAQHFMPSGRPVFVSADKPMDMMTSPATAPVLVSAWATDDCADAQVPGSVNMPRGAFRKPTNLAKLPPKDRLAVPCCCIGNGAAEPALPLKLMGNNAAQIQRDMMRWSPVAASSGRSGRLPSELLRDTPIAGSAAK